MLGRFEYDMFLTHPHRPLSLCEATNEAHCVGSRNHAYKVGECLKFKA